MRASCQYFRQTLFVFIVLSQIMGSPIIMHIHRTEVVYNNEDFLVTNFTVRKVSRTDFAVSWNVDLYKKIDENLLTKIQVYAFQSNEYRRTPIYFSRPFCSFLKVEYRWFADEISKCGNFNGTCPCPPTFYYVHDYIVDASKVPPMPWKDMLIEVTWELTNGTLIAKFHVYVKNNQENVKILSTVDV